MIILSALAAALPMICYLLILWWFDKYDREPFRLVLVNFLWGAVGAIFFASLGSLALSKGIHHFFRSTRYDDVFNALVIAPVVEEITKGAFLLLIIRSRKFDNITDGLVFGGAIGLGFGMTENFLYFITYGSSLQSWLLLVFVRSSFSAVMHCVSTASLGTFLAIAKFGRPMTKIISPAVGLSVAITIHFIWNFAVSFRITLLLGILFIMFAVAVFATVFILSVYNERRIILRELAEEIESSLIPENHVAMLVSGRRNAKGWIDENIRKDYVRALTVLAFRKMQFKNTIGAKKEFYAGEIEQYRSYIKNLLTNTYIS